MKNFTKFALTTALIFIPSLALSNKTIKKHSPINSALADAVIYGTGAAGISKYIYGSIASLGIVGNVAWLCMPPLKYNKETIYENLKVRTIATYIISCKIAPVITGVYVGYLKFKNNLEEDRSPE